MANQSARIEDPDFNPMREHFEENTTVDPRWGVSKGGNAVLHDDPLAATEGFALYVSKIPGELKRDGLANLFSQYGKVIDVYIHTKTHGYNDFQWGVVTFRTENEAQTAITNVHGHPPFYLSVVPKRIDQKADRNDNNIESNEAEELNVDFQGKGRGFKYKNHIKAIGPSRPNIGLPLHSEFNEKFVSFSSATEDDSESEGWNAIVIKGKSLSIDFKSLKSVQFGYDLVARNVPLGNCLFCKNPGNLVCSRCHSRYCSRSCQLNDWPNHRNHCIEPPPLANIDGSQSVPVRPLRRPVLSNETEKSQNKSPVLDTSLKEAEKSNAPSPSAEVSKASSGVESLQAVTDSKKEPVEGKDFKRTETVKTNKESVNGSPKEVTVLNNNPEKVVTALEKDKDLKKSRVKAENVMESKKETTTKVEINGGPIISNKNNVETHEQTKRETKKMISLGSALDTMKTKSKFDLFLESLPENFTNFYGTVQDENTLTFLLRDDGLPSKIKTQERATKVQKGDYVILKSFLDDIETLSRAFVLETNKDCDKATLLNIDFAKVVEESVTNLLSIDDKSVLDYPGIGIKIVAISPNISEAKRDLIGSILDEAPAFEVIEKKDDHIIGALLDPDLNQIELYKIYPWYFLDNRAKQILGLSKVKNNAFIEHVQACPPKTGDEVSVLNVLHKSSNFVVVHKMNDLQNLSDMETRFPEIIREEAEKLSTLPEKNQIIIFQGTPASGIGKTYYRGCVISVDPGRNKVKIRSIDYGHVTVEDLDNLYYPSVTLLQYPVFAYLLSLDNVEEKLIEDEIRVKLEQLRPQLKVPFQVEALDKGKPAFILRHPNGKTLNEMINRKLQQLNEAPVLHQGQVPGGNFDFQKCHKLELPLNTNSVNVLVLHYESPFEFYLLHCDQMEVAVKLPEELASFAQSITSRIRVEPVINEVCVALDSDDSAGRAVCVGYDFEGEVKKYLMFFADYGYKEYLPLNRILQISEELMQSPFLACKCRIEGVSKGTKVPDALESMLQSKLEIFNQIEIDILGIDGEETIVRIPELREKIQDVLKSAEQPKGKEKCGNTKAVDSNQGADEEDEDEQALLKKLEEIRRKKAQNC